jgi:tRNA(fMet)-specific endonuclease VapC
MIVLDTDHISELQYPNSARGARLLVRLIGVEDHLLATTIVTFEEQMRGWLAAINKQPAGINQVESYSNLVEVEWFFRDWLLLPFDRLAAEQFHRLKSQKIRINTMDLKIAAIVLRHGATLRSANLRDFRQVPGLSVEDWLSPE